MKRRKFLSTAASGLVLPFALNGFGIKALANDSPLVNSLMNISENYQDRVLVLINMVGGNDGLNTVIPLDQMSLYNSYRSNIAIPQNQILPLNNTPQTGFHPSLTGLQELYNTDKLCIVNGVSYANPNLSHYRANEIWMTATDANVYSSSGWAGRYLDDKYPNYPTGYPNATMTDPLAIQIGYLTSPVLSSSTQSMGLALSSPAEFAQLIGEGGTTPPNDLPCCEAGDLIQFIRQQQVLSIAYSNEIKNAANAGTTMATYPSNNSVADQLKIVAKLIHGGLQTKIYFISQATYDTHSAQVGTSTTTGDHANLLSKLSAAILAFQQDLVLQGTESRVLGMTYSEFGRRVNSNSSKGTDHGVAAPLFVFGSSIKKKIVGTNPNLSDLTESSGQYDIKMQCDFRSVYRDMLQDWFGITPEKSNLILSRDFPTLSILTDEVKSVKTGNWLDPYTWNVRRVPNGADKVLIQTQHKVTINAGETAVCKFINIQGGFYAAPTCVFRTTG